MPYNYKVKPSGHGLKVAGKHYSGLLSDAPQEALAALFDAGLKHIEKTRTNAKKAKKADSTGAEEPADNTGAEH